MARAAKEYHRREEEATGFECTPEDMLAYQYYRNVTSGTAPPPLLNCTAFQALESRERKRIASFVEKGLVVARSETAREKLVLQMSLSWM